MSVLGQSDVTGNGPAIILQKAYDGIVNTTPENKAHALAASAQGLREKLRKAPRPNVILPVCRNRHNGVAFPGFVRVI